MLYKIEKYGKEMLKAAAKGILRYDTSIDDLKFNFEINPLDLLRQLNISENSEEYKLFVFDDVEIKKGDVIGQGIFMKYGIADNDVAEGERKGGFGSTGIN